MCVFRLSKETFNLSKSGSYLKSPTNVSAFVECVIGPVCVSRYMARLRAIGAYWGLSETIEDWTQEKYTIKYFTGFAFYIAVHCCFDKHLYPTSCLNAHNHNRCVRLPQTGCITRKMALFIISQDRQTQVLAAVAMATTIIID